MRLNSITQTQMSCNRSTLTPVTSKVMREAQRGMWMDGFHFI